MTLFQERPISLRITGLNGLDFAFAVHAADHRPLSYSLVLTSQLPCYYPQKPSRTPGIPCNTRLALGTVEHNKKMQARLRSSQTVSILGPQARASVGDLFKSGSCFEHTKPATAPWVACDGNILADANQRLDAAVNVIVVGCEYTSNSGPGTVTMAHR